MWHETAIFSCFADYTEFWTSGKDFTCYSSNVTVMFVAIKWQACWKSLPSQTEQSSSQSMMMMPMGMDMMAFEGPVPEPTIEEQLLQAFNGKIFLEEILETEPDIHDTIDQDEWDDFIGSLESHIEELQDSLRQL